MRCTGPALANLLLRAVLACGTVLLVNACTNLTYGEHTGFNLGVYANPDPATPVKVHSGLHRSVVVIAPPKDDPNSKSANEAVDMIASFNLTRSNGDTSPLVPNLFELNTLVVSTDFATGEAATKLDPKEKNKVAERAQ